MDWVWPSWAESDRIGLIGLTCIALGRSEWHGTDLDYRKDWIVFSWFEMGWIGPCLVVLFIVLFWIELEQALTGADLDGIGLSWIQLDAVRWVEADGMGPTWTYGKDWIVFSWFEMGWN